MPLTSYDVFISYARTDTERVKPLCDELRRLGFRVFLDVQSIDPGEKWKRRLEHAIHASRALVLCWSQHARESEYVIFEYSRAQALRKPVFPWYLDSTPLPVMLEIQGIEETEAFHVAAKLRPRLGWPLNLRRRIQELAALLFAIVAMLGVWRYLHPVPWKCQGNVIDRQTLMPIAGVEVDVETERGTYVTFTNDQGRYEVPIPQPQPRRVGVLFRKNGYEAEHPIAVSTVRPFVTDMEKLH